MEMLRTCLLLVAFTAPDAAGQEERVSLIEDLPLSGGFNLSALVSTARPLEIAQVMAAPGGGDAQWRLAQWGSRFSAHDAPLEILDDGARVLGNEAKRVVVLPGGLAGEGVVLSVRGGVEYDMRLRRQGEPWPHLLIEQKFAPSWVIHTFAEIPFQLEFQVLACDARVTEGLDPGLHTAHVTMFLTLDNGNPNSADHNDMIWFGVPLFDARRDVPRGHQAVDGGQPNSTNKFICTIDGARFYDAPIRPGEWRALECNLVPLMQEALEASQAHGFLTDTRFEDLRISSMNLGWEVPGPYDCAIQIRRLRMEGVRRE